jgi:hypothetical protein
LTQLPDARPSAACRRKEQEKGKQSNALRVHERINFR